MTHPADEWGSVSAAQNIASQHWQELVEETSEVDQWAASAATTTIATPIEAENIEGEALFNDFAGPQASRGRGRPAFKLQRQLLEDFGVDLSIQEATPPNQAQNLRVEHVDRVARNDASMKIRIPPGLNMQALVERGRLSSHQLMPYLLQLDIAACSGEFGFDEVVKQMAEYFLNTSEYKIASQVVYEKLLSCEASVIQSRMNRLACMLLLWQHYSRVVLERKVVGALPPVALICYLDVCCYDETPMKMSVNDPVHVVQGASSSALSTQNLEGAHGHKLLSQRETCVVKLLQIKAAYAFVLNVAGEIIAVSSKLSTPLQSMRRNTSGNLLACLLKTAGMSHECEKFQFKVRSVCSDKAGANLKCERMLSGLRPGWSTATWHCAIHSLAGVHQKAFDALCPDEALIEELHGRPFLVNEGRCPQAAMDYKVRFLQVFCDQHTSGVEELVQLLCHATGDWRKKGVFEVFWDSAQSGPADSHEKLVAKVAEALLGCLCSSRPALWPRHRWVGFKQSLHDCIIFEGIHGLLVPTYRRFLQKLGKSSTTTVEACAGAGIGVDIEESLVLTSAVDGSTWQGSATTNSKDRDMANDFIATDFFPQLLLMGMVLQPLELLLRNYFRLAGADWQESQVASAMKMVLEGIAPQMNVRLEVAAALELEIVFFDQMKSLYFQNHVWELLPERVATIAFNAKAFMLISRVGACVETYVANGHRKFPTKLWLLLKHPHMAEELLSIPSCLRDPFTAATIEKFPSLNTPELFAMLRVQGFHQSVDISVVEALHASVRRQVHLRSCQTWSACLSQISSEWVLQVFRRLAAKPHSTCKAPKKKVWGCNADLESSISVAG
eukprot:6492770-Amphidinium_carterae.2